MFKNIISDFGKVLVYVENDIMTSPWVSDEADRKLVGDVVFDRIYWNGLDDGTLDYASVKAAYRSRLPERLWDVADNVLDNAGYRAQIV